MPDFTEISLGLGKVNLISVVNEDNVPGLVLRPMVEGEEIIDTEHYTQRPNDVVLWFTTRKSLEDIKLYLSDIEEILEKTNV